MLRRVGGALILLGGAAFAVGAHPADEPKTATGIEVHLSVYAADGKGKPVADLSPRDFELRDNDAPESLDDVRFVGSARPNGADDAPGAIQTQADEQREASRDGARLFAFFLDEYHVDAGESTDRVKQALLQFVDRELTPADLAVVLKPLDSLMTIRMTHDKQAVRQTIESFDGRKGDYEPRNAYERNYIAGTPARIELARTQVALSAINALAVHLGSLTDRRKTLVVATEGISRADRRRGQEYLPTLDTIIRSANQSNVAIYPLDPSDAPSDETPAAAQSASAPSSTAQSSTALGLLAGETDGRMIRADLSDGLLRVASDTRGYYLLSFRSTGADDGKFHEVRVAVKRAGVRLRSRKGYFAASPDEALRASLLAHMNEPKRQVPLEPAPHVSPWIKPWFGMDRGDDGKTRLTFVWEPSGMVPGERVRHVPSRLVLKALGKNDEVLFEGVVLPTGAGVGDQGASARATFDTEPGRLRLRMSIQDAASQVIDSDIRNITVRDFSSGVMIGTPEILRARNAREFRSLDSASSVPVASREFSRAERLLIKVQTFGPGGQAPYLTARLMNRGGQAMRELQVTQPASAEGANEIDLPLAGLAAGEYLLELTAKSPAGDVKDLLSFRVTS
jgi:VWFA-related protein